VHPALGTGRDALRAEWRPLEGLTRDRVEVLGEDYALETLVPAVTDAARRLLDESRKVGRRPVLIAETPTVVSRPFAQALGIDDVVANVLGWQDERCTGELVGVLVGPELDPRDLSRLAERLNVSLGASAAYGASGADRLLLGAVGAPCALHPDPELARVARDLDWPIVGPTRAPFAALDGLLGALR
jgi:phosphoserine phosphatase